MEERAKVPPGLPRSTPTKSYWQTPRADIADFRSHPDLPSIADYVIIGSGISGVCIARNLLVKRPHARVVMLEARQACSGATGRNGGHTKAASYRSFLDHERDLGLAEAIQIARLEYANILATHDLAEQCGIDCASTRCQTVDIIYSATQLQRGLKAIARMRQTMGLDDPAAKYHIYQAAEAREKFLTPSALGAFEYEAGSLSAYDLTIDILRRAIAQGLNLQTTTPAHRISSASDTRTPLWIIHTARGALATPTLILATNGYTSHLLPQMQGVIVPLHGQVVAQRPGAGLPQTGLGHTYSFIHDAGYEYMITRPGSSGQSNAGDVIIGGGLWQLPDDGASRYGETDDGALERTITPFLRTCAAKYFGRRWGSLADAVEVKAEWSGIMGASADGLPLVGPVPDLPGLWMSAGFNGHGMVWCLKAAEAVVEVLLGGEAERRAVDAWFPRSAWVSRARMEVPFAGRPDLKAPGV